MVIAAFIVNYEASSAWLKNQRKMWLYFLGEVNLPMFRIHKLPVLVVSLLGYFIVLLTFSGSVTPSYGQDKIGGVPSLGQGNYEVILFADYFCPPCRMIDAKVEPVLKELLVSGNVKITFVDVPRTKVTPIYAHIFLYAVNAGVDADKVFHIRKTLFDAAQVKNIQTEDALVNYLKEEKIAGKKFDEKPVFQMWSNLVKEHKINQTPTCIIKYFATDVKKYVGTDEIWDGLVKLKSHLEIGKK
jgi:protein-disulfide isomerase